MTLVNLVSVPLVTDAVYCFDNIWFAVTSPSPFQ